MRVKENKRVMITMSQAEVRDFLSEWEGLKSRWTKLSNYSESLFIAAKGIEGTQLKIGFTVPLTDSESFFELVEELRLIHENWELPF